MGRSRFVYGAFHLWGDIPALMPRPGRIRKVNHHLNGPVPPGTGKTSWFFGNRKHELRDGVKIPGQDWNRFKKTGEVSPHWRMEGMKGNGGSWFGDDQAQKAAREEGIKQGGNWWHDPKSMTRMYFSKSAARREASAHIAKIPFPLAYHIGQVFHP